MDPAASSLSVAAGQEPLPLVSDLASNFATISRSSICPA
jgi:hypothetical protein